MKTSHLYTVLAAISLLLVSCSDESSNAENAEVPGSESTPGTNPETPGTYNPPEPEKPNQGEVEDGKCVDSPVGKTEPGECGCNFEDKDIDLDGKIDCPVRVMPNDALIPLEDIPGTCAEWEYPKHPTIELPDLPEFGYEVTIDTEKYNLSNTYDESKAKETTDGFNKALKEYKAAGYTRIKVPAGHYPVTPGGLSIPDHTAFIMGQDVILQMIPTESADCHPLQPSSHVYIEGGTIIGDVKGDIPPIHVCSKPNKPTRKDNETDEEYQARIKSYEEKLAEFNSVKEWQALNKHEAPSVDGNSEECNGINIWHDHVFINGITIKRVWGDGIMIVDYSKTGEPFHVEHVIIANSDIQAGRNGAGAEGGHNLRFTNNYIHNMRGQEPQSALDFEPNSNSRKNINIIVDHNRFVDNAAGDIFMKGYNAFIEYNTFSMDKNTCYIDNPLIFYPSNSTYLFYRNKIEQFTTSVGCGYQLYCSYGNIKNTYTFGEKTETRKTIPDISIQPSVNFFVENEIVPQRNISSSSYNRLCVKGNVFRNEGDNGHVHESFAVVKDLRLINNRIENVKNTKSFKGWYLLGVYGKASGNIYCTAESNNTECFEETALNAMKDNERFDY